jgi:hypothetical protein
VKSKKTYLNLTEEGRKSLTLLSKRSGKKPGELLDLLICSQTIRNTPAKIRKGGRSARVLDKNIKVAVVLKARETLENLRGEITKSDYVELLLKQNT